MNLQCHVRVVSETNPGTDPDLHMEFSDAAAGEEPLRNRAKKSTSAKFGILEMKSTLYHLHKTSNIIEKLLLSTKL